MSPEERQRIARAAAKARWADRPPAEPVVQSSLRLTVAQRDALAAYMERRGLASLNEAVRDLIHRTTLAPKPVVQLGPTPRRPGEGLKPR